MNHVGVFILNNPPPTHPPIHPPTHQPTDCPGCRIEDFRTSSTLPLQSQHVLMQEAPPSTLAVSDMYLGFSCTEKENNNCGFLAMLKSSRCMCPACCCEYNSSSSPHKCSSRRSAAGKERRSPRTEKESRVASRECLQLWAGRSIKILHVRISPVEKQNEICPVVNGRHGGKPPVGPVCCGLSRVNKAF